VLDLDRARQDTPGCFGTIHLHNSGSALMPNPVNEAVKNHLDLELFRGGYEAQEQTSEKLEATYSAIAKMLNCTASEIALSESATASWNSAFYGFAQTLKPNDKILTCRSDYVSNMIAYRQIAERTGAKVQIVPNDENGVLDTKALETMIDNQVKLISITHVPTYNGLVSPVIEIGLIANDYGVPYLVDACQSAGQMPLDVVEIGCDALSATGRKYLRGPRGTGFLYVRESSMDKFPPAVLDLHSATWVSRDSYEIQPTAQRYEMFESNIANRIGLGVAVDYAMSFGLSEIYARIRFLANHVREMLEKIDGIVVRDMGEEKCGIVTFTIDGMDAEEFQQKVRRHHCNVGISKRNCALIDFDDWQVDSVVRCSVHYYNTEHEIEMFARLAKMAARATL